jgi:hypothetical protein
MSLDLPESDWRRFKETHAKLLERYSSRILEDVTDTTRSAGSAHERYLKVYKLIEQHDKQIANAFNDFRRSTAVVQLAIMRRMKLLTDEELSQFSERTRVHVEGIASLSCRTKSLHTSRV